MPEKATIRVPANEGHRRGGAISAQLFEMPGMHVWRIPGDAPEDREQPECGKSERRSMELEYVSEVPAPQNEIGCPHCGLEKGISAAQSY